MTDEMIINKTDSCELELRKSLDQVPHFPSKTAASIVEEELESPVDSIFDSFDREPIVTASLGISYSHLTQCD